jgi:hypothetical protein
MIQSVFLVSSLDTVRPETMVDGAIFVLPGGESFQYRMSGNGELGFNWKSLLGIGAAAANFIPGVGQFVSVGIGAVGGLIDATKTPGQARGLAQINAFGQQVIGALEKLLQTAASCQAMATPQQIVDEANKLAAMLSNSAMVYQAQKGNDAEALANFKQQAAAMVQQIQAAAAACAARQQTGTGTPGTTTQIVNGQVVTVPTTPGGIDTTTLLLFGGVGILALYLVMK